MTLLLAWAAFDDGKDDPAAIYITTDSRISWGKRYAWDFAQKVFCVPHSKEIFGYCGDVMCVTQTLSQIVQLANLNTFDSVSDSEDRVNLYASLIGKALATYPREEIVSASSIIYVQRNNKAYRIFEIEISKNMRNYVAVAIFFNIQCVALLFLVLRVAVDFAYLPGLDKVSLLRGQGSASQYRRSLPVS